MADKKSAKKKKKGLSGEDGPNKDETEVAKHLRFNLETKKAMMYGDEVHYFMGSKAIDLLLDSKWATGQKKSSVSFTHRDSVSAFLSRLLNYGLFSRVHLVKTEKKVKDKKKDGEKKKEEKNKETEKIKVNEEDKEKDIKKAPKSPKTKRDKDGKESKKVKKKVKITLEPHEHQTFFDSDEEVYVWIYDPISWKTFVLGILLVLAIIGICLFPLWPESVREYSWYVSVAGAIFVGAILILAILRYIIYGVLWIGTFGKLNFWLLPNLTAECGFLESFVPVYEYEMKGSGGEEKEEKKKSKRTKEQNSEVNNEEVNGTPENDINDEKTSLEETETLVANEQNESEDNSSSGSIKDEEWVKVKKVDAEESEQKPEEVKC